MRKLCCALWIFLLTLTVPALATPGKRDFFPPQPVADPSWVKKIVTGDFNGDGKLDFATLAWDTGDRCVIAGIHYDRGFLVRVYRNTTPAGALNPTFAAAEELPYIDGSVRLYPLWSSDIAAVDFDRDGKDDIVVANAHSDQVFAYRSLGSMFAAPVVTRTEDDPSYMATGDFNADGVVDLALLHMSRNFLSTDYHWKFSFVLGDRSGRFSRPVIEDLGDWSFPTDLGPYYNSNTFQFSGVTAGVKLPNGSFLDSVYMNGPMKWLSGGAVVSAGGQPMGFFRRNPWGFALLKRGTRTPSLAEGGGRYFLGGVQRLGDITLAQADSSLLDVFLNADGSRAWLDHFGQAVVLADLDLDGILDLAMMSNERPVDAQSYDSRSLFVAYGDAGTTHPLSFRGPIGSLTDRYRTLSNMAGIWALGHKAGHLVSGDFNGDSYPDLLTDTVSGILVHANVGGFGFDKPVPRIVQTQGIGATNKAQDLITLSGDFVVRGYKVGSVFFTSTAPQRKIHVPGTLDETRTPPAFSFRVPDDSTLPAGDYVLSAFNGSAESQTINPPVKIRLRPLAVTGVTTAIPANGSATFPVTVKGWFGNDPADQATNTVNVLDSRRPGMRIPVSVSYPDLATMRFNLPVGGPVTYTVVIDNARRGTVTSASFSVDHTPQITFVGWTNPAPGGSGSQPPRGTTAPIKPGAEVLVESSMLLAPDTVEWRLLKGNVLLASGAGKVADHTPKDNMKSSFQIFPFPSGLGNQTGVTVQLVTRQGLISNAFGPLTLAP